MGSRLGDRDKRHDQFFRRARRENFAARSVYKLEEIDQKTRLLSPGARVLDLGCRPGSWLQYAARQTGTIGAAGAAAAATGTEAAPLVGLDREPLEIVIPGARILIGDVYTVTTGALLGALDRFDVVLSDMAPDTTGVRSVDQARSEALFERALEIAETVLAARGNFLGKLFQGPDWQRLIGRARARFQSVKTIKPESSRRESIEQYVVALGFKPL